MTNPSSILGAPGPQPREVTHLSYSGRNTYEECGKKFDLSYIMQAPKQGSVWFVGGLAVHRATEEWDVAQVCGTPFNLAEAWKRIFHEELDKQKAKDPDMLGWRKAGKSATLESGEDVPYWYSMLGPQLVENYIAWRKRSPWQIWTTPEGEPAIELNIGGTLPGMDGVEFKGYIDRVFYDPQFDQLHIVDLKTGSRKPETALQLGIYGAATAHRYGVTIPRGSAFMNRKAALSEPWPLEMYTPEYVGRHFKQMYDAIQAGYFVPKIGRHCGMCDVASACYAQGGPLAHLYDRDHPGAQPGF